VTASALLPPARPCTGLRCPDRVVVLPLWDGRLVRLDARPATDGNHHVHAAPGHTIAQRLHTDAARAFHGARLPLWRLHACDQEAPA
jgi:hypothetical protein